MSERFPAQPGDEVFYGPTPVRTDLALSRGKFWARYGIGFISCLIAGVIIGGASPNPKDGEVLASLVDVGFMIYAFRLLYRRAIDVGYKHPGWMTLACIFPFVWLFVACRGTNAERGAKLNGEFPR